MEEQASVIGNGLTNNVVFFIGTTLLKSIRTGCRANNVALIECVTCAKTTYRSVPGIGSEVLPLLDDFWG